MPSQQDILTCVGLMLAHRLQRRSSIRPTSGQHIVLGSHQYILFDEMTVAYTAAQSQTVVTAYVKEKERNSIDS